MTGQNRGPGRLSRAEVAVAAREQARIAVNEMIAGSAGRTITQLRSKTLTWPGADGVEPEPVAGLEAACELERAAHALVEDYIRSAREAGRSWYEIGQALDLHWAAVASKESIADEAYDYALRYQPGTGRRTFSWTCPACQNRVTDNGPWPDLPGQEDGHAAGCARRTAQLDAWHRRTPGTDEEGIDNR
jgi:hypothetical protein